MSELEAQQHLKDCLKHIRDSIRYLYSTSRASYSQLMVATHKVESDNEEIWDKVRARAAMTTDSGEGTTELGQQIAKLMATMTRTGQAVSLIALERQAVGGDGQTGVLLNAIAPIMPRPVLDRLPLTAAHLQAVGQGPQ